MIVPNRTGNGPGGGAGRSHAGSGSLLRGNAGNAATLTKTDAGVVVPPPRTNASAAAPASILSLGSGEVGHTAAGPPGIQDTVDPERPCSSGQEEKTT